MPREVTPGRRRQADPFESMRSEMDRVLDSFLGAGGTIPRTAWPQTSSGWSPNTDVRETGETFQVTVELPGVEEKDVEVVFRDNVLSLKGEKKDTTVEGEAHYVSERRFGPFQRSFQLPDGVDPDGISASFVNGVLTIGLPKKQPAQTEKRIKIGG